MTTPSRYVPAYVAVFVIIIHCAYIYKLQRDDQVRLTWVIGYVPTCTGQSPIQVITGPGVEQLTQRVNH